MLIKSFRLGYGRKEQPSKELFSIYFKYTEVEESKVAYY